MEYRINRRTGDKISIIGIGTSSISEADKKEASYIKHVKKKELEFQL